MEALLKNQIADRRLIREVERERAKLNTLPRVTEFYRSRRLKGNDWEAYTRDYDESDEHGKFSNRECSSMGRYTDTTKDSQHFLPFPRVTSQPNRYSYIGCNIERDYYSELRSQDEQAANDERFLAIYGSKYSDPQRKTAAERYGVSVGFKNYAGSYQAWVHEAKFYNSNRELKKPVEFTGEMGPIGWKERMLTPQQERFDIQDEIAAKDKKKRVPFTQLDKPGNPSYISAGGYYTMDLEPKKPAEDQAREKRLAAGKVADETGQKEDAETEGVDAGSPDVVATVAETERLERLEGTVTEETVADITSEGSAVSDDVFGEPTEELEGDVEVTPAEDGATEEAVFDEANIEEDKDAEVVEDVAEGLPVEPATSRAVEETAVEETAVKETAVSGAVKLPGEEEFTIPQ